MGHDAIVLKSGWDEYGIAYGKPTKNVHIRSVNLQSSLGAGLAFGSEMSGGISNILVEQLHLRNSFIGIALKTTRGRGGYMKDIIISNVEMENIHLAIEATGQSGSHPDEKFDPDELPFVKGVTFENMVGTNITFSGNFSGLDKLPFTSICLSNISFSITWNSSTSWFCSNVMGFSKEVSPKPCSNLRDSTFNSSAACFFSLYPFNYATVLWDHHQKDKIPVLFNLYMRYRLYRRFSNKAPIYNLPSLLIRTSILCLATRSSEVMCHPDNTGSCRASFFHSCARKFW